MKKRNFTCQETLVLKFSTTTRYLVRWGGPYLSIQGARLKKSKKYTLAIIAYTIKTEGGGQLHDD